MRCCPAEKCVDRQHGTKVTNLQQYVGGCCGLVPRSGPWAVSVPLTQCFNLQAELVVGGFVPENLLPQSALPESQQLEISRSQMELSCC